MTDNKSRMNEKIGPTPASFRYKEPLRHEMEGGKLSGHVQVFAPGHAESLQDRRHLDREFELLPGFQSSSKDQDQDDPIWSDKNLDTQSSSSNCSSGFKVSIKI